MPQLQKELTYCREKECDKSTSSKFVTEPAHQS